jgi:hypothetical protein
MSTTWERFQGAALSLARSGALKDRLAEAYRRHLAGLDEEELPDDVREQFRCFNCALTRCPPLSRGEDAIRASLRKMSNDEAEDLAASVVRMFSALPRQTAPALRNGHAAQVIPLYLAEA